jgi:release factor glutamine methyltransferase
VDVSEDALALARENAALHGLDSRVRFETGNWHDGITERFDVVVSNPPYIPSADIEGLMPEVRNHDPVLALDGGADGLDPYRILFDALPQVLKPGGMFAFEFGHGQAARVQELARSGPGLVNLEIIRDLTDKDRVIVGRMF